MAADYRAADARMNQLRGKLADDKPLIIATVVNIDALEQTSMLGRLVSEQVSTHLAQGGLKVLEMKPRHGVHLVLAGHDYVLAKEGTARSMLQSY